MSGMRQSSSRDFGHERTGYAVEFNLSGFACRSLTVETEAEAEVVKQNIESADGTSKVEVVRDD